MTKLLIKCFIKNSTDVKNRNVRAKYSILSAIVGIILNIFLFVAKYLLGILSGSIAIKSSAFDHLSDSASCIVTLFGVKLSLKPADKDHPFGHGRLEYITTFIISSLIIIMGTQLFSAAIKKIVSPNKILFSYVVVVSLFLSLGVKLWMSYFYRYIGRSIDSKVMLASADDARNDCVSTVITIISAVVSPFISFPLDGGLGALVSLFVIKNGIELIKDTVDDLLGRPADKETTEAITSFVMSNKIIIGMHDLMVHSYGPGSKFGSCHVEIDKQDDILEAHDIIDSIEREIYEHLGILMTIHMDPIDLSDPLIPKLKKIVENALKEHNSEYTVHDFRIVKGKTHTNLVFDIVVPFEETTNRYAIENIILERLGKLYPDTKFYLIITFDRSFC